MKKLLLPLMGLLISIAILNPSAAFAGGVSAKLKAVLDKDSKLTMPLSVQLAGKTVTGELQARLISDEGQNGWEGVPGNGKQVQLHVLYLAETRLVLPGNRVVFISKADSVAAAIRDAINKQLDWDLGSQTYTTDLGVSDRIENFWSLNGQLKWDAAKKQFRIAESNEEYDDMYFANTLIFSLKYSDRDKVSIFH